jgi:hypothetical protein
MSGNRDENPLFLGTSPGETDMAIGSVPLPGVYDVTQTSKGMTAKYIAEKAQSNQTSEFTGPDSGGGPDEGDYAKGVLLVDGEPVLDGSGSRILISRDNLQDKTILPDQDRAEIVADDTQDDEEGETIWVVVDSEGNRLTNNATGQPLVLAEGGYSIATSESSADGDDSADDSGGGESRPPYDPRGEPTGTPAEALLPEGFKSIQPQPIELSVSALCTTTTWNQLDELRDQPQPFDVAIGEFAIERMGIVDLSREVDASTGGRGGPVSDVTIKLKQFEEVTVKVPGQPESRQDTDRSETPGGAASDVKGWIDQNNDGIDDRSGQPIPEYREIVVDEGETRQLPASDGGGGGGAIGDDTLWGNNLIDVSAEGASVHIDADGGDWVIKNVGIKGQPGSGASASLAGDPAADDAVITVSVSEGATGVIENVYMANAPEDDGYAAGGIYVRPESRGTLQINRVNIQNKPATGIHASDPGETGGGGGGAGGGDGDVLFTETFADTSYRDRFTYRKGDSLDTVSSTQSHSGGSAMEVPFPSGSHDGMTARTELDTEGIVTAAPQQLYLDYWVYFPTGFDCNAGEGKKLPGPVNYMEDRSETDGNGDGHGGDPADGYGWSARAYFIGDTGSQLEVASGVYHMDQSGTYADTFGETTITKGDWHRVQQRIKLNTTDGGASASASAGANPDGLLQVWIDGEQRLDKRDFRFTNHPEEGIKVNWTTWFGGTNTSPQDQSVYIDDFTASLGGFTDGTTGGSRGPPGGPGGVDVFQSYLANNGIANLRLGQSNSGARECVIRSDGSGPTPARGDRYRGVWQWYTDVELAECHISHPGDDYAIVAGREGGRVTLTNSRVSGSTTGPVDGDSQGEPKTFLPEGCPESPTDAAGRPDTGSGGDVPAPGDGESYETITVPAGQVESISVSSGETVENLFIDITADGAGVSFTCSGNNWTLRNIGVKGQHPGGFHQCTAAVRDQGATGTIEHCYFGNPQAPRTAKGGLYLDSSAGYGTIRLNQVYMAGKVDNGFYGDGDGQQSQIVENCYFYNNTIANVRVGSRTATPRVENTTVYVDGGNPPCGAGCSSPGSTNTRAIWASFAPVDVIDCDIRGAPLETQDGGSYNRQNVRTGDDADISPPAGVPTTPIEGAAGTSSA